MSEMKTKKCDDCGGLEFKINYFYTHLKSKKHIKNHKKNTEPNILNILTNDDNNHLLENINNIIDVCNHIKEFIKIKNNNIII